jgi:uncharacterized protein
VGDFTALSVLEDLRELAPVEAVHGNMDEPALRRTLPERTIVDAEGMRIGLVHDAGPSAGRHDRLVGGFPGCDLVAYGHSHVPELAQAGETWIVNPGSPTERRRAPGHTMVVVRSGVPELVRLD